MSICFCNTLFINLRPCLPEPGPSSMITMSQPESFQSVLPISWNAGLFSRRRRFGVSNFFSHLVAGFPKPEALGASSATLPTIYLNQDKIEKNRAKKESIYCIFSYRGKARRKFKKYFKKSDKFFAYLLFILYRERKGIILDRGGEGVNNSFLQIFLDLWAAYKRWR